MTIPTGLVRYRPGSARLWPAESIPPTTGSEIRLDLGILQIAERSMLLSVLLQTLATTPKEGCKRAGQPLILVLSKILAHPRPRHRQLFLVEHTTLKGQEAAPVPVV